MWFRRLFRRRRKPPPLDLSSLDRLEELIARVIAHIPDPAAASPAVERPTTAPPTPSAPPAPAHEPVTASHLLFLPGYELVELHGPAPARGARIEREGRTYCVLRHGPSPLPGDRRRCAFLETA